MVSDERRELLTLREHLGSLAGFGGVRVAQWLSFLYCVVFVCLRPVSFVPNDLSVSGLFSLDCPFEFS